MARLTVRLPDSLHRVLAQRAEAEGVSKNQYIVYALSQVTAVKTVAAQRAAYAELLERLEQLGGRGAGKRAAARFSRARAVGEEFLPAEAAGGRGGKAKRKSAKAKRPGRSEARTRK